MAIVKPIKVRAGSASGLKSVLDYIANPDKTMGKLLVYGKDCMKENTFNQMMLTKSAYNQTTGRQYAHFVQSFSIHDKLTPEQAFEIGQQYIDRLEKFKDYQVLMAVHTNEEHLHIHYVINSVNSKTGQKWQSTPQDLMKMRQLSDELCIENNLSVLKGQHGWQSYGENSANQTQKGSWKQQLAKDIAECLEVSKSKAEFYHALHEKGLDADFGSKNIMFFVEKEAGQRYGLKSERRCGNDKLLSYGDFSKENIENTLGFNDGLIKLGWSDFEVLQEVLMEVSRIHFPNNPTELEDMYFNNINFGGLTKKEIEILLKQRELEKMLKRTALQNKEKWEKPSNILPSIIGLLEVLIMLKKHKEFNYTEVFENEYEL